MIYCKKCGYEGIYTGINCPNCGERITLEQIEILELKREINAAKAAGEFETVVENYLILADAGITEAEREYAKILEKGALVPRNIDKAMEYFYRAAKKCDPYSAYRYSRLVARVSEVSGKFWLYFSAALGCADAYMPAAEAYVCDGQEVYANYYYYLAAAGDDVDAIVKLATRYFTGDGVEESVEYAKWYMEKLNIPPLYALKLAYKLRGVKSKEPPTITINQEGLIRRLIGQAEKHGFDTAKMYLYSMLAERGDANAMCDLAEYYLFSDEGDKQPAEAVRLLTRAAASGSARAYTTLGLVYRDGSIVKQNLPLAIESFERAAKLGATDSYEYIGDIYHNSSYGERDISKAHAYYERAARGGCASAAEKAKNIRSAREAYYYHATRAEEAAPEDAFRGYAISAMMGYVPAMLKLAECYALGIGTKRDRHEAFVYYGKCVAEGCDEAYFPLGICYSRGVGTQFNFDRAIENLTVAHRLGDERAKREILRLYENKKRRLGRKLYSAAMRLVYKKNYEVAAEYLTLATNFDHPKATYTLGCLYEFGRGVAWDRSRAYELYRKAESQSFSDPRSKYKSSILKMLKRP